MGNKKNKKVNKKATLRNIIEWGSRSIGYSIDATKLNLEMAKSDWEKTLIQMANFCGTEIIYK